MNYDFDFALAYPNCRDANVGCGFRRCSYTNLQHCNNNNITIILLPTEKI